MICVEMNGRLGNQMFRYAFARMLQLQGGERDTMFLDFSNIYEEKKKDEMPGWEDSLRHFCVAPYQYYDRRKGILWDETGLYEKAILGLIRAGDLLARRKGDLARIRWRKHFLPWLGRHGIYLMFVGYDYPFRWVAGKKLVSGPFECASYPASIRSVLLREFTPRYPVLDKNRELLERIESGNSVCMTIRRGNFLLYPTLDVCTASYFERAARRMGELVKAPVFFVFSDEVDWARENIHIDGEVYYEDGDDPVWEKLRLMYSCKHFIISNSTFSWWAQFLGRSADKVVIAPNRWFNGEYQPPLYEKNWHLLEV